VRWALELGAILLHHIFLFAKIATHFSYRKQKNIFNLSSLNGHMPYFLF
jgi:hypothetical protein